MSIWHPRGLLSGSRARRAMVVLGSLLAVGAVVTAVVLVAVHSTAGPPARCSVAGLSPGLENSHVRVTSATRVTTGTYTPRGSELPITGLPKFCAVTLTETDAAGNPMHLQIWLPAAWNGSFEGVGGRGYACTMGDALPSSKRKMVVETLKSAIESGYASSTTDCGLTPAQTATGSFALKPDGGLNWPLINDFTKVGIHDAAVEGKAVTAAFYGSKPRYSFFFGCSTGGREGLMEAQQYPADYNGIVSGAPAINMAKFIPAEIWPQLVMNHAHDFLPSCKEVAFIKAVVKACGRGAGVIKIPSTCHWNPALLVGSVTPCGKITKTDAAVVAKIWQGPTVLRHKLWFGLEPGASFAGLARTTTAANGVTTGNPFPTTTQWLGTWLQRKPSWDWRTLSYAEFDQLFAKSVREFSGDIATDNPDLASFRNDGGKILIWHGLADPLIFPQSTISYYQRVLHSGGGAASADSFARLFLAPGAGHCASAAGAAPSDPLTAVVNWVEHGKAPQSIPGTVVDPQGVVRASHPLCMYPLVSRYKGGSTASAASYACVKARSR